MGKTIASPRSSANSSLAGALFTQTQQRVPGLLFGQPNRSFTVSELIAATGAGSGAVQRELAKLADSGLITMQPQGNQKLYRANASGRSTPSIPRSAPSTAPMSSACALPRRAR